MAMVCYVSCDLPVLTLLSAALRRIEVSTSAINDSVNVVQEATNALLSQERRRELMQWVAPDDLDPDESYESALSTRQYKTGIWFLESTRFKSFLVGPSCLIWIYGNRKLLVQHGSMILELI